VSVLGLFSRHVCGGRVQLGEVEFRILGAVRAVDEGGDLDLGPPQQRCVLALLLLEARRPIHIDRLIDLLWEEEAPRGARTTVQVYVSKLRKVFSGHPDVEVITTSGPSYQLNADPERVDVHRFRRLVAEAGSADGDRRESDLLTRALEQWTGPALDDVAPAHLRHSLCAGLAEEQLAAWEQRIDTDLRLGRHARLVPELIELVRMHPLRERLTASLMIALYRSGRRADALAEYQQLRARLAEELGVDPTPAIDELHGAVLRDDPSLVAGEESPMGSPIARPIPAQLPADLRTFTGRVDELDHLLAPATGGEEDRPSALVISAIDGMAGVGKTALAVHAAHRMAQRYPDGQLFIDLHGFTQGVPPVEPAEALDRILRTLGIAGDEIPRRVDDRAALYRSTLAGRRMLVVLDNVATESQVQPLLPAAPGCMAIITSRRHLGGLDDVRPLSLDILAQDDAMTLFIRTVGEDRLAGEPSTLIADVVELCGRLPLAVRIAASRLRARPKWRLSDLSSRLRDERRRIFELEVGERSVAAAVGLSYEQIPARHKRMFALLGLHPGSDIDMYAAAALTGTEAREAGRVLDDLLDAHLLEQPRGDRYQFHDLVRAHASHICGNEIPEEERNSALGRLFNHYAYTSTAAMDAAYPLGAARRPRAPGTASFDPSLEDSAGAMVWLDAELANVLAVAAYAADHGWDEHTRHLAGTMHGHLHALGHYTEDLTLQTRALDDARRAGDATGELDSLIALAQVYRMQEQNSASTERFEQALALARDVGDRLAELDALIGLGNLQAMWGWYDRAVEYHDRAIVLARSVGDEVGELDSLIGLGFARCRQSRWKQSTAHYEAALNLARHIGSQIGELSTLLGISLVRRGQGRYTAATESLKRALRLSRSTGRSHPGAKHRESGLGLYRWGELNALVGLGEVFMIRGRYDEAVAYFTEVLRRARAIGNRNYQFEAMRGLGETRLSTGDSRGALDHYRAALDFARELEQHSDEAIAHDGLARVHHSLGRVVEEREHLTSALAILTKLDLAQSHDLTVDGLRARLADLDQQEQPTS
jgi:DNA-binding SARP family transcriptional activator/tetratricopeptide (TPR) repeat protein